MVDNSGEYMIKVVDDLLDTLTNGEHRRTIKALETDMEKTSVRIFFNKISLGKYPIFLKFILLRTLFTFFCEVYSLKDERSIKKVVQNSEMFADFNIKYFNRFLR